MCNVLHRFMISAALVLAVAAAMAAVESSLAARPATGAASEAVAYIRSLQNPDGGFPFSAGDLSSPGATIDAVYALAAAGVDLDDVTNGGNSPLDYLAAQANAYSADPGAAPKLLMAVVAADGEPREFGGVDLVERTEDNLDYQTGRYGVDLWDHLLFMLAWASVELDPPSTAVSYLVSRQLANGGWEFDEGFGADTNTTALAIQALIAAGRRPSTEAVQNGLGYLASAQNDDGGFPYSPDSPWGTDSDANSTAIVLQALVAAGENIDGGGPWDTEGASTPLEALLAFQNPDTGAFTYAGADNAYATYQAVPALLLKPLPIATMSLEEPAPTRTPSPTLTPAPTGTVSPTATATPTLVLPPPASPTGAPPVREVAGVSMPAAGAGGGPAGGAMLLLAGALAAAGALAGGAGLAARLRRR